MKKYVWFNLEDGIFSNSWDEKTHEMFTDVVQDTLDHNSAVKLIQFECLNDDKFEFYNLMKVVTNK